MKSVHLVCNAHIDPVWLWQWQEGAAEAISTFRTAADFCEEFDGFVFNHNEAVLYRWVEEYEPALFRRIQRLVRPKKWHIMGGWHLQPDCNMPSGESFVRQILLGNAYFREKFGVKPTTAINFDPFGHTRGLVQILAKSGYDSYVFCRPSQDLCALEKDQFIWEGYDGSRVLANRSATYGSTRGKAAEQVERFIRENAADPCGIVLWGVGNHGGGPSRADLKALARLMRKNREVNICHSTPEAFFAQLERANPALPVRRADLNSFSVGCYTSQIRVKQGHRLLENELYSTEKMAAAAHFQKRLEYPAKELRQAMLDLATSEFHDALPGSLIQPVEAATLRLQDHALEILGRVKARAFFRLAEGQPKAKAGEIPLLVYNPHPFPVQTMVECEFQLADQNWTDTFTVATAFQGGKPLPTQLEKELSSLNLDWRKRAVFPAQLAPSQMNRFDCRLEVVAGRPRPRLKGSNGRIRFKAESLDVIVNTKTGLIDRCRAGRVEMLAPGAFRPLVFLDNEDPWGMRVKSFRRKAGAFKLLSPAESARFAGVRVKKLPAVRVIEDGPARVVVEALFGFGNSRICQQYKLPRRGTEIEVELRVHWNEKDRMLKLSIPTLDAKARYMGQVAYGADELKSNGDEAVAQKWVAAVSDSRDAALTVLNDGIYGSDFSKGEIRLSLLRSAVYSGHPIGDRPIVPQDRYTARIDQGERFFSFRINAGRSKERMALVDREALVFNEKPMALSFFPSGAGTKAKPFVTLSDPSAQLAACKKAEAGDGLIARLFEPAGRRRATTVSLPFARMRKRVVLEKFEILTFLVDLKKRTWTKVNLLEQPANIL